MIVKCVDNSPYVVGAKRSAQLEEKVGCEEKNGGICN